MQPRYYTDASCSDCGATYKKRKDALKVWSGLCMRCSRKTTGLGKGYVSVSCKDCNTSYHKRADSLKVWKGRCKSCTSKHIAQMPHIKALKSESAKRQVAEMGGIPNGNRFTSADGGENHWNWKGGVTEKRRLAMGKSDYRQWRKSVFERDDYTCQMCGKRGGWLDADHILPWSTHREERYNVDNGRTLCRPCHKQTPTWGRGSWKTETVIGV